MDKQKFGELLKYLRTEKGISQKDMADIMKVTSSAVSKWEKGFNYPDFEIITWLADYFGVSMDEMSHPEETLQKLQSRQPLQSVETNPLPEAPSMEESAERTISGKKLFSRKTLHILVIAGILFCIAGGILIYNHCKNHYSVRAVAERISEDPNYGPSYDLAFLMKGDIPIEELKEIGEKYIPDLLKSGLLPRGTKVYRFFFYTDEQDAQNWATPESFSIFFP